MRRFFATEFRQNFTVSVCIDVLNVHENFLRSLFDPIYLLEGRDLLIMTINQIVAWFHLQVAVNTNIQDVQEFLNHVVSSTNMKCLTPP